MDYRPTIAITMGDPAGIGPEVIVKALADPVLRHRARYVIYGMNELLHYAADLAELDVFWWRDQYHGRNKAYGFDVTVVDYDHYSILGTTIRSPSKVGGEASMRFCLDAIDAAQKGFVDAVVTAPIAKESWKLADRRWVEHYAGEEPGLLPGAALVLERCRNCGLRIGIVTGADGTVELMPGLVRIPDVAFTSWDRLPGRRYPTAPIPRLAPNLAVEMLSRSNTPGEMAAKRQDYFAAGVRLVWEVDPEARTVSVYTAPANPAILNEADTIDGGAVLPGFTFLLRDLFGELDRQG